MPAGLQTLHQRDVQRLHTKNFKWSGMRDRCMIVVEYSFPTDLTDMCSEVDVAYLNFVI